MTMTETESAHATKKDPLVAARPRAATRLAATEYERVAELLEGLSPAQWLERTDCPLWDVREMAGHMLGMVQMVASVPEMVRQQATATRRAKRTGGEMIDSLTALQVEKNADLTTQDLVRELRRVAPRAVRASSSGSRSHPSSDLSGETEEVVVHGATCSTPSSRATPSCTGSTSAGRPGSTMTATAEHEGAIVDDVVREWAGRHGSAYALTLTGPAGGSWQHGGGRRARSRWTPSSSAASSRVARRPGPARHTGPVLTAGVSGTRVVRAPRRPGRATRRGGRAAVVVLALVGAAGARQDEDLGAGDVPVGEPEAGLGVAERAGGVPGRALGREGQPRRAASARRSATSRSISTQPRLVSWSQWPTRSVRPSPSSMTRWSSSGAAGAASGR